MNNKDLIKFVGYCAAITTIAVFNKTAIAKIRKSRVLALKEAIKESKEEK